MKENKELEKAYQELLEVRQQVNSIGNSLNASKICIKKYNPKCNSPKQKPLEYHYERVELLKKQLIQLTDRREQLKDQLRGTGYLVSRKPTQKPKETPQFETLYTARVVDDDGVEHFSDSVKMFRTVLSHRNKIVKQLIKDGKLSAGSPQATLLTPTSTPDKIWLKIKNR